MKRLHHLYVYHRVGNTESVHHIGSSEHLTDAEIAETNLKHQLLTELPPDVLANTRLLLTSSEHGFPQHNADLAIATLLSNPL